VGEKDRKQFEEPLTPLKVRISAQERIEVLQEHHEAVSGGACGDGSRHDTVQRRGGSHMLERHSLRCSDGSRHDTVLRRGGSQMQERLLSSRVERLERTGK
jgi:hypothetical protein